MPGRQPASTRSLFWSMLAHVWPQIQSQVLHLAFSYSESCISLSGGSKIGLGKRECLYKLL